MNVSRKEVDITWYDPPAGESITKTCQKVLMICHYTGKPVGFQFNDAPVIAEPGESAQAVEERFWLAFKALKDEQ